MHLPQMLVRSELSAALTVTAVLAAGTLAKLGFAWWAIGVVAAFCLLGVIERLTAARPTQLPSNA
jgi:bacteriorhodopsin